MPALTITFEEPAFPDLEKKTILHTLSEIRIAVLEHGMETGRPSIAIRIDLDEAIPICVGSEGYETEGKIVLVETSARLFCTAAKMIMTKYPELFNDEH